MSRVDTVSRHIAADAPRVYAALIDPEAMSVWRPPAGMRGEVLASDARPGGTFRMALHYDDPHQQGKSGDGRDVFESRFVSLVENEKVVEAIDFSSADPAFSGTMTITTTLDALPDGTEVTIACTDVPPGIGQADHVAGLTSTLGNLAAWCEALASKKE